MPQPSTVLILGARGRFGRAAVHAFAQAGWQVLAQVRPGAQQSHQGNVRWLGLAPRDTSRLAAAAAGASVVVHGLSPAYTHRAWRTELPGLTQAAIDVTRALGATLMLPASVYNFGAAMPPQLLEDTPQRPTTFKGRMRLESEAQVRAATQDGALRAVVIRAGDFFGSGAGSWFDQVMAKDLRSGRYTHPGPLDVATPWAYLPDLARCFVAVAQARERLAPWEMLHFTGHTLTGAEWASVLGEVAREQGWLRQQGPLRLSRLPWPLLRIAGVVLPTFAALHEMRYLWRTPHGLVNRRMAELIGPEPRTPLPLAVRAALGGLGLVQAPRAATLEAAPSGG